MIDVPPPKSELILYQAEDGRTRIQCRLEDETIWLTQALLAELFQKDVRTINEHLVNLFDEGELRREATIRKFRIVRVEGSREVAREVPSAPGRETGNDDRRSVAVAPSSQGNQPGASVISKST